MSGFRVSMDADLRLVTVVFEGEITIVLVAAAARDARKKAYDAGYSLLYDVTGGFVSASISEGYTYPREVSDVYEDRRHKSVKSAILYDPTKDREILEFYETTASNAGLIVKLFERREDALEWLASP